MPCKCSGYRFEKCTCKLFSPGFPLNTTEGQLMILTQKDSNVFKPPTPKTTKSNLVVRALEYLYEICARFNIRYCVFRKRVGSGSCYREALRDLVVLVCFLLANLVVFTAILSRMTMHLTLIFAEAARWIRRLIRSKMITASADTEASPYSRGDQYHDFLPPCCRKPLAL